MALKDIKTKIKATERTHKVTRAMEAVSAVKMRKTQSAALAGRPYARAALSILARFSGSSELSSHPLVQFGTPRVSNDKKIAVVVITSDKGLAGALNSSVIKAVVESIAPYSVDAITFYVYGKKGQEYFARRAYTIAQSFENRQDVINLSVMEELASKLSKGFAEGNYDEVLVAYSNFKSTFEQVPTVRRLLPLSLIGIEQLVKDIVPVKGKWSEIRPLESPVAYKVEPSESQLLEVLLPRLVADSLYHFLLEAKASEHSARMVAMKNASDKSKEVAHDLKRLFNKIRQSNITREVSEIVGGREVLKI